MEAMCHHVTRPELSDYFLGSFDWFVGGNIGEIANTILVIIVDSS